MACSARLSLAAVALTLTLFVGTGAAEAAFEAHGSVEQVYVTGLPPRAKAVLLDASGKIVARRRGDSLGGLLFRDVKPGGGYRVRMTKDGTTSAAVEVLSTRPEPPSTKVYDQQIPSSGYG